MRVVWDVKLQYHLMIEQYHRQKPELEVGYYNINIIIDDNSFIYSRIKNFFK